MHDGVPPARGSTALREATDWLESLSPRGIALGLERVEAALARLGDPHKGLRCAVIAGTNGKGSTASFLASIMHEAGYRVGLYTSPHLVDVTERVRVGGIAIQPHELVAWTGRVRAVVEGTDGAGPPVPLTFFEALTVAMFGFFAEREVDLAVLEVGLGGRLDAVNVARPSVSVLTTIGLDHQAYLGDTLDAICREKAGIIHSGSTVVSGVQADLFQDVVGPRAFAERCPIRRAGVDFQTRWLPGGFRYRGWIHRVGPVRLGLRGLHQGDNAGLACAAAESLTVAGFHVRAIDLAEGLRRARHPGRLERREAVGSGALEGASWPAALLDGAHNPMAAEVLARHVSAFLPERPRVLLFAARPDKDLEGLLAPLVPLVDHVVLTRAPGVPLADADAVALACHDAHAAFHLEADLDRALRLSCGLAGPRGGLLVAGSLYLVGAVSPRLPSEGRWQAASRSDP